jgi:ABC-type tungstate transport system permease subunit
LFVFHTEISLHLEETPTTRQDRGLLWTLKPNFQESITSPQAEGIDIFLIACGNKTAMSRFQIKDAVHGGILSSKSILQEVPTW